MASANPNRSSSGNRWKTAITADRARELISYTPDTGVFTWRKNMKGGKRSGSHAGYVAAHGYLTIRLDGKLYYGHRLAWLLIHGVWPENEIDHENGDRVDNRLANLRPANRTQQSGNLTRVVRGQSGRRGVYRDRHGKKWVAQIHMNGKQRHIGTYETIEDAAKAYASVARAHFGEFARVE